MVADYDDGIYKRTPSSDRRAALLAEQMYRQLHMGDQSPSWSSLPDHRKERYLRAAKRVWLTLVEEGVVKPKWRAIKVNQEK